MSQYVVGEQPRTYQFYAVSNHFGSLAGGHCKHRDHTVHHHSPLLSYAMFLQTQHAVETRTKRHSIILMIMRSEKLNRDKSRYTHAQVYTLM